MATITNTVYGKPLAFHNDISDIPGTVRLFENYLQHGGLQSDEGTVVLVPAPSDNVNDPLNWSKGAKAWVSFTLLLWTFLANACIAWCSVAWAIWVVDLKTDFVQLNYGQALLVMMCGLGVMFLQPVALKYGRRPSYLIGSILIIAGLACGLAMTSVGLYFVYMLLGGMGSAPSYSTIVTSLLDISFLHQKGRTLSMYGFVLLLGNFIGPLVAGYIVDGQGWVWVFRYLLILFCASTLLVLFTAEETSFARPSSLVHEGIPVPDDTVEPQAMASKSKNIVNQNHSQTQTDTAGPSQPEAANVAQLHRFTYHQKMAIYRNNLEVKASYWKLVVSMVKVATLPAAIWASIQLAFTTLVVGVIMTTQASLFSIPPYKFTPAQLGLMYIPLMVGSFIGVFVGGSFTDWLLVRMSRQNGGIHEPENRLWMYIPVPLLAAAGSLLYGIGGTPGAHWIIPCIGLVLIGIYINVGLPIALGYALDSYPALEDEIVQLSNFVRNVGGGAMTFCIQPWINMSGPRNTVIYIVVIVFVVHGTSILFQFWGKNLRRRSAPLYYKIYRRYL